MKITLEKTDESGWLVVCGDRFSSMLGPDEALGVFAAFLFGNRNNLPYLRTYAQTRIYDWQEPAALLPATVEPMPVSDFIIYRRELLANVKGV